METVLPKTNMNGRLLVMVTGASRGFGRCIAEQFVHKVAPFNPVDVVLVARSAAGLRSAEERVDEIVKGIPDCLDVVIRQEAIDLGDLEVLEGRLDDMFAGIDPGRYARAILVNNAGSLGHISFATELPSLATLRSEMDFNITSALWLSSRFASIFGARKADVSGGVTDSSDAAAGSGGNVGLAPEHASDRSVNVVVNISSLAAVQPFDSWGGYSTGKAARDMFHRVLAAEQSKIGGLKVLNYAPGPMNTDMARDIRSDEQYEDDLRSGKLIDPQVSAAKCVGLALGAGYKSGAHIDFFDEVDNS